MKSLVKNRLYSSRTKTVEDLNQNNRINNSNIIKHQKIPFKYLVHIINYFC